MEDYVSQGRINQLSSGHAAVRSSFGTGMASTVRIPSSQVVITLSHNHVSIFFLHNTTGHGRLILKSREPARSKDKLPRQDRAVLRDRLFALFREKPYWNISVLKAELNQPDVWLRDVLKDVAVQVKEGPYRDMWQLKEALRMLGPGAKPEDVKPDGTAKEEDEEEETEDELDAGEGDFDEDDFEEILG